ncbi:alkaline phosphatase family protein [Haloarcula laminariae]|uniref:alkaline phosphatase family protein n=1 Tax=Haloarcula laminariae TaxID=2961577 RepID=UPI002405FF69|nr:alkaline phosphatase family protein [Halomicroarcula sp. FL173]
MTGKIYVIGLDGIPPRRLESAVERGDVPNLERAMDCVSGKTVSTNPPLSMLAWSTFATGQDAGKHGIYNFMLRDEGKYTTHFPSYARLRSNSTPLWEYLDAVDVGSGVMNLMPGYPPSRSKGFHIGDNVTSPNGSSFIHPRDLSEEIEQEVTKYELEPVTSYSRGKSESVLQEYLDSLFGMEQDRTEIGKYLIQNKDCQVFTYIFLGPDSLQHSLGHLLDENHPEYNTELAEKYGDKFFELLSIYDEFIGWLMEYMNEDDILMVLSDHGHGSVKREINLNSWLYQNNYLHFRTHPWTKLKLFGYNHVFEATKYTLKKSNLLNPIKKFLTTREVNDDDDQDSDSSNTDTNSRDLKDMLTVSHLDYDWSSTKAYTIASGGQIFLNTEEKHEEGWITTEYERICNELVASQSGLEFASGALN